MLLLATHQLAAPSVSLAIIEVDMSHRARDGTTQEGGEVAMETAVWPKWKSKKAKGEER